MDFNSLIKKRKSVRSFKNKTVSFKDVLEAIDSSLQGPYAGNINKLKFIIVEDKTKINEIASHCNQPWIGESSSLIVVCSDDQYIETLYGERGKKYARQQAGAAIGTILFKLVDLSLSASWVGSYSDELIRNALRIPKNIEIDAIIPIGYEKINKYAEPRKKRSVESRICWEFWGRDKRPWIFKDPKNPRSLEE